MGIEEVYFGKAKDVVGDLRSKLYGFSACLFNSNTQLRYCAAIRDQPRTGRSSRDDQLYEQEVKLTLFFGGEPAIKCTNFSLSRYSLKPALVNKGDYFLE